MNPRTLLWLALGVVLGWAWANRSDLTSLWTHRQQVSGLGKISSGLSDLGVSL